MIAVNRRVPKNCLESVKITATGTGSDVQMTEVRKSLVCTAALVFALAPHSTFSQDAGSANGVQHFGIAAKRPVFAGACNGVSVGYSRQRDGSGAPILRIRYADLLGLLVQLRPAGDGG